MQSNEQLRQKVRDGYGHIAKGSSKCCCGTSQPEALAKAIGYTKEELEILPQGANMGLSCGNPTALAGLKPGQVVLDLGSGGGFDVFIAAKKVAPGGMAIGVDMTPEMLSKARAGIPHFTSRTGLSNVQFRLGEIEFLPVADSSVDVIISNCVINLSPDKQQVWNEIARVLKPGGKACISDLALKKSLPAEVLKSAAALISCVAGAVLIDETRTMAQNAGLTDLKMEEKPYQIDALAECNDPLYREVKTYVPAGTSLGDYIVSVNLTAQKPAAANERRAS
ncbi:MAG: arsenite methyltransferase [Planctomycetaceae bacterium]|nr:arsenite methyltransferase [Planctomycetaceae bacterium]